MGLDGLVAKTGVSRKHRDIQGRGGHVEQHAARMLEFHSLGVYWHWKTLKEKEELQQPGAGHDAAAQRAQGRRRAVGRATSAVLGPAEGLSTVQAEAVVAGADGHFQDRVETDGASCSTASQCKVNGGKQAVEEGPAACLAQLLFPYQLQTQPTWLQGSTPCCPALRMHLLPC